MQALGQASARHGAAGVLVDQEDLVALDDVLDVAVEQGVRAQRCVDVGQQAQVVRRVEALAFAEQAVLAQQVLDELVALLVEFDLAGLLVDAVVAFLGRLALDLFNLALETRDQLVDLDVQLGAVFGLAGDDQRVRASSMRIESTSSTTAKFSSRWNLSSRLKAMLSRR